jgi:hypothetical protein
MKKSIYSIATLFAAAVLLASSCKPGDEPNPEEGELITSVYVRLTATNGFDSTFIYKVQNGFGSTNPGLIRADTLALPEASNFDVSLVVLNENKTPHEDVTGEINTEKNKHVFLYNSEPVSGPGSVAFSDGSRDDNNNAYNLTGRLTTGAAGTGRLRIFLVHEPLNKTGTTPQATGGETEVEAVFPVMLY